MREYLDSGCSLHLPIPVISANTHARIEGYFRLEWKLAVDRPHLVAPDQARISAELISVGDDTRVWSETYDRTLDDVFKVQGTPQSPLLQKMRGQRTHNLLCRPSVIQ